MQILQFLKEYSLSPESILCGFSGGADSTALLLMLKESACAGKEFTVRAVHFEHGLRGKESRRDAEWCRTFCRRIGVPCEILSLDVPKNSRPGEGTEEAARRLRLESWRMLARPGKDVVALAHNANDRIENMFLRMIRGSNSSGVTSMREYQELKGLVIVRPLLGVPRAEIEKFLAGRGIFDFRMDSSNRENDFRRNYLRNVLLKKLFSRFCDAEGGLLSAFEAIRCDADFIEQSALKISGEIKDAAAIPLALVRGTHPAVLIRVLRYWLSEKFQEDVIPDGNLLERLISESAKFADSSGMKELSIPAGGGRELVVSSAGVSLNASSIVDDGASKIPWNWKNSKEIRFCGHVLGAELACKGIPCKKFHQDERVAYFDAAGFPDTLMIRRWADGDRMIPFGFEKPVKVKKVFEGRKIPARMRSRIPLVCLENGDILWIPGVRRANFAPVGPETREAVVLRVN